MDENLEAELYELSDEEEAVLQEESVCEECDRLLGDCICWNESDIDDEPPPDYGPPGSGAIIVEYTGNEPGWEDPF